MNNANVIENDILIREQFNSLTRLVPILYIVILVNIALIVACGLILHVPKAIVLCPLALSVATLLRFKYWLGMRGASQTMDIASIKREMRNTSVVGPAMALMFTLVGVAMMQQKGPVDPLLLILGTWVVCSACSFCLFALPRTSILVMLASCLPLCAAFFLSGDFSLRIAATCFAAITGLMIYMLMENFRSFAEIVTSRQALEEKGRIAELAFDEARAALAVKSEFLANMTHEFRTPLNAIIGFSSVLKSSGGLNDVGTRQLDLIRDASQTLLVVVNDVLDFSRLEAGAVAFDVSPFDPLRVAESAAALLADEAASKGLALTVTADGPVDWLLGDGDRLRQVLLNFIANAVKFTAHGAITVQVRQTDAGDDRRLRVEVTDSGIGIAADQIDTIFDRFTQADASISRQYGGTGLGLAICKRIIDGLGGRIGVASQPGRGATFWFEVTLPAVAAAAEPVAAADDSGASGEQDDAPMLRLLVVDDNATNRELVCALLSPFAVDVDTANDGQEAVEAAARSDYDLILMDIQMPVMDGLTATRRIREMAGPGRPRVPIVAMTANVLPEQVARCFEAGMDDHFGKPINPQRLLESLERWTTPAPDADRTFEVDVA